MMCAPKYHIGPGFLVMSRRKKKNGAKSAPSVAVKETATNNIVWKRWGPWAQGAVVLAVLVALSIRLFDLISRYAVNIFFMDQWDFDDATLFQKHTLWEMFRWQHGPHRQGVGALLGHLIEPHFGWNSRSEAFFVGMIIVLAAILALWLKFRLFGSITVLDICIPLIFLNTFQHETLFMTANLAHGPVPIILILLYCLAWTIPNLALRYGLVLLLNFGAIYTGFGIFLGLITPVAVIADYLLELRRQPLGKFYLVGGLLVSVASLGSFFIQYAFVTAVDCSPNLFHAPLAYIEFLLLIFANLIGIQGADPPVIVIGGLVALAIVAAFVLSVCDLVKHGKTARTSDWIAAILLSFCLIFTLNTAYGRSCLGPRAAQESRYIIYMETGLLGVYFYLLGMKRSGLRAALLAILTVVLIGTVPVRKRDEFVMRYYSSGKENWRACYLSLEDINQCTQMTLFAVYPRPEKNNLKGKLEFLKRTKQNLYSDVP